MLTRYSLYLIVVLSFVHASSSGRPVFNALFQLSGGENTDSRTGLPLRTTITEQKLSVTKQDVLRQSKSTLDSSSSHMVIDQLKSVQLNATSKLNETACIALNAIQSLQSVACTSRKLKLIFDTAVNSAYTYHQWLNSKVRFVNGGKEWNCTNSTTKQPILIMMKLVSSTFKLNKNEITVDVTNDTDITPLVCFDNITLQMAAEQELPPENNSTKNGTKSSTTQRTTIMTTTSSPLMKTQDPVLVVTSMPLSMTVDTTVGNNLSITGRCSLFHSYDSNSVYMYQQPLNSYRPGQQIYISWSLNGNFDRSIVLQVILKRVRFGVASNIISWNVQAGQYQAYLTIPALPISTQSSYFIDIFWYNIYYCTPIPHWQSTTYFQIPTAPIIVVDSSAPGYHSTYYPGETVSVRWTVQNAAFPSNILVTLRLNRRRFLIPDEQVSYVMIWPSQGSYQFTIPSNLPRQSNSDEYYIRLDWYACSWISLGDTSSSDSQSFYIPTELSFSSSSPAVGDSFTSADTVRIAWTARNFASDEANNFLIKLKRYRPLIWDETIYTLTGCPIISGVCFDNSLSRVQPSVADFYYEFSWCGLISLSCSADGHYFQIPVHLTGGWNYNAQRDKANAQLPLFHADCQSSPNTDVTRLCNANLSMAIDLTCTNCYMKYDYSIIRLDLIASGGVLGRMNVQLHSITTVNLELLLTANYIYQKSDSKKLNTFTLMGFSFSVLGISFEYGSFLDLELPYRFDLNAIGHLSGGLQYQLNTNLQLYVIGTTSSHNMQVSLIKTSYPVTGDFKANLVVDIALKPTLRVTAIIFSVGLTTEGFLRLENIFQYPPFDARPFGVYDYNPSQPSLYYWSYPSDACSSQHLLQYHIQFGIRNTLLTFDINLGSSLNSYISRYTPTHYETRVFPDSTVYELVSGCLFKLPYNDYPQPANLYLDIPYDSSLSISEYFKTSITYDLAKVVNVDPTRILLGKIESYYDQTRRRTITLVKTSLLPSALAQISDPNVRTLADTLLRHEINPSSILYTGTQLLKSLLNDLTQQSNNNTGMITTPTTSTSTTTIFVPDTCPLVLTNTTVLLSLVNASMFNYTYYRYTYRATSNQSALLFGFRQDPSYWCLDDISVINTNISVNLIVNGGFESGSLVPFSSCALLFSSASGRPIPAYAHAGNYSYYDGATGTGDYLWQTFFTIPQQQYNISFWLQNLGGSPNTFNVTIGSISASKVQTTVLTSTTSQMSMSTIQNTTSIVVTTTNQTIGYNSTTISTPQDSCLIPSLTNNSTLVLLSLVNSPPFNYTYFRYNFQATSNRTILTFALRQDPSYWCLDDIAVTINNLTNTSLIRNGGFEAGSIFYYSLCSPWGFSATGSVQTRCPHSGLYSYYDGTYAPGDYLSQSFDTVRQQQYQISFWLQNLGSTPNSFNLTISPEKQQTNGSILNITSNSTIFCSIPLMNNNATTILLSLVDSPPFNYTLYQYIYRALSNFTTITFAFRQDPSYWCLDDISIKQNRSYECIVDGSFESASLSAYSTCNSANYTTAGIVNSACPHTGTYNYYDGISYRLSYLSQRFSTISQTTYEIRFWLRNLGSSPNIINVTIY